jgi:transposase InsO family protein
MAYSTNPNLPKVRQQAVNLVYRGWSCRQTARYIGTQAGTVSKWLKKDHWYGRIPIPTLSSRPLLSPQALSEEIVEAIVEQREKRNRCAEVIHQELLNQGIKVSLSSVKRTLERQGLIRKRSPWKRWHFTLPRPEVIKPGDLIQIDTVHLGPANLARIYVYALIDVFSRWAHAKVSLRINTHKSLRFLKEAVSNSPFPFQMLQSDHGSEFSSWFTEQIRVLGLAHRHSRVRKPSDNGHVERFIRTLQEECLLKIPQTIRAYQREIPEYLQYYNNERLHLGLQLKTPLKCFQALG